LETEYFTKSERQLRAALQLNPDDTLIQTGLTELLRAKAVKSNPP
jgi:hypothetical protein